MGLVRLTDESVANGGLLRGPRGQTGRQYRLSKWLRVADWTDGFVDIVMERQVTGLTSRRAFSHSPPVTPARLAAY